MTRREVMAAGAVTLGAVGAGLLFSGSAGAQSGEEAAVSDAVEVLRKGILEADKAKLAQVTSGAAQLRPLRRTGGDQGAVHQRGADAQGGRQVARVPRAQGGRGRQRRHRPPHLPGRIRAGRQGDDHADRRPAGLAEAGRRLEAAGAAGVPAAGLDGVPSRRGDDRRSARGNQGGRDHLRAGRLWQRLLGRPASESGTLC